MVDTDAIRSPSVVAAIATPMVSTTRAGTLPATFMPNATAPMPNRRPTWAAPIAT